MVLSMSSHSKGQAFAPDFMASIVMFGFMLSVFFISWNTIIDSQVSNQEDREMYIQGQRTMTNLINSPGSPENWDQNSVETLGLAERPHVLNSSKIEDFRDLDSSEQRSMLNAVNFNLKIVDGQNTVYDIGPAIDGDQVYSFKRSAMLNQSDEFRRVEVRYAVWE